MSPYTEKLLFLFWPSYHSVTLSTTFLYPDFGLRPPFRWYLGFRVLLFESFLGHGPPTSDLYLFYPQSFTLKVPTPQPLWFVVSLHSSYSWSSTRNLNYSSVWEFWKFSNTTFLLLLSGCHIPWNYPSTVTSAPTPLRPLQPLPPQKWTMWTGKITHVKTTRTLNYPDYTTSPESYFILWP